MPHGGVSELTRTADVFVVGGGIIGLCCAASLARRGKNVLIVSTPQAGEASRAAAGMLAPSVEQSSGPAHEFAVAGRDYYPEFLDWLADDTGIRVPLNRLGILQVAVGEVGAVEARHAHVRAGQVGAGQVGAHQVRDLEAGAGDVCGGTG